MAFKVEIADSKKSELDEIVRYFVEDEEEKKLSQLCMYFTQSVIMKN